MVKKPFFFDQNICLDPIAEHVLDDYQRWFARPYTRRRGEVRPRTVEEIKAWLVEIGRNQKNCYFSIRIEGENVGHLGIRNISQEESRGELDWFVGVNVGESRIDCREIVSWLRYFIDVHLEIESLVVPAGCLLPEEIFQEAGFEVAGRDSRGSLLYVVAG